MKTINQIDEGQLVRRDEGEYPEYAVKQYCVHHNPYYAYLGSHTDTERAGYSDGEMERAEMVSDWDDVSVSECCG